MWHERSSKIPGLFPAGVSLRTWVFPAAVGFFFFHVPWPRRWTTLAQPSVPDVTVGAMLGCLHVWEPSAGAQAGQGSLMHVPWAQLPPQHQAQGLKGKGHTLSEGTGVRAPGSFPQRVSTRSTMVSTQGSGCESGRRTGQPHCAPAADLSSPELRWHQPPPTATGRHSPMRSHTGRASVTLAPVRVAAACACPPGFSGDLCPPSPVSVHSSV